MALFAQASGRIVYIKIVDRETKDSYAECLRTVVSKGFEIQSIIADGFPGLNKLFPDIPFQFCQFHQQQIVRRALTRNPKSEAAKSLKAIADGMFTCSEQQFAEALGKWYQQYSDYLNEWSYSEDGQSKWYKHKQLRKAYYSLKRNQPYLFTFERYPDLKMPNTTNPLEGRFTELKRKVGCHPGMRMDNKILFIKRFFDVE